MFSCTQLLQALKENALDSNLAAVYGSAALPVARDRAVQVTAALLESFAPEGQAILFSGPGRTEIGGNHTDHQHGRVLCGSVDLDMLACASPNALSVVRIQSQGYPALEIDLNDLSPRKEEENTSAALVRGVAAKIRALGYELSGFDACATSTVLSGSGLSSSAAYETLVGCIFNRFCCRNELDAATIARIGQYAENIYFGKPCGLMDQMGSSVGGAVFIDFNDPANPLVKQVGYDFGKSGHALCIVDTGSSHDDLTEDYASIPQEMGAVAAYFGRRFLREVRESQFRSELPKLRQKCGDRAVLRAMHFYADDRRAVQEAEALEVGDFAQFLTLVNESGLSSSLMLQNIWSPSTPRNQAVSLALAVGRELLKGTGAIRVHGGGFAGTIQAFVPDDRLDSFKAGMEALLGQEKCHILHIRPQGGCVVAE